MIWTYPIQTALRAMFERRPTRHFVRGMLTMYLLVTGVVTSVWEANTSLCWWDSVVYALTWPLWKFALIIDHHWPIAWMASVMYCGG